MHCLGPQDRVKSRIRHDSEPQGQQAVCEMPESLPPALNLQNPRIA